MYRVCMNLLPTFFLFVVHFYWSVFLQNMFIFILTIQLIVFLRLMCHVQRSEVLMNNEVYNWWYHFIITATIFFFLLLLVFHSLVYAMMIVQLKPALENIQWNWKIHLRFVETRNQPNNSTTTLHFAYSHWP